ncbi:MAG: hypothetical protein EA411_09635 [Saprospirales bacterium]|nr:MAG: hypothetical protein EA411_09635 [Saprospirales bacterium]
MILAKIIKIRITPAKVMTPCLYPFNRWKNNWQTFVDCELAMGFQKELPFLGYKRSHGTKSRAFYLI